ncbi:MAG: FHA domain-containing protein [Anaerolineales bacterium]|nr:FHA domain-containing protein [Anaerolineales bacterium]
MQNLTSLKKLCLGFALILLLGSSWLAAPAFAQETKTIARITITELDSAAFPEITLRALIQNGMGEAVSAQVVAEHIRVFEDGSAVTFTHKQVTGGVETIFVLDAGAGVTSPEGGGTGKARLDEMIEIVREHVAEMGAEDRTGILLHVPGNAGFIQTITSDKDLLNTALDEISLSKSDALTRGYIGIMNALNTLAESPYRGKMVQSVIYVSSGVQTSQPDDPVYGDVVARARQLDVPVHTVFLRQREDEVADKLRMLAFDSGGLYTYYDDSAAMEAIRAWLAGQRVQFEFSYHSTSISASDRTVEVRYPGTDGGSAVTASETYLFEIKAPQVELLRYQNGDKTVQVIGNDAPSFDVGAEVTWPDGYQRELSQVELLVNGVSVGPSGEILPEDNYGFSIDTSAYQMSGDIPMRLQVLVTDEYGLQGASEEVTVILLVRVEEGAEAEVAEDTDACEPLGGVKFYLCRMKGLLETGSQIAGCASLGLALVAIGLAFWFRRPLGNAAGKVADVARETFIGFTRVDLTEASAYLQLEQGGGEMVGKRFDLFPDSTVKIGRDRRQVSIVFEPQSARSVVSRVHCEIGSKGGDLFFVRDLGSTHGTFVNAARVAPHKEFKLKEGDKIILGLEEHGGIVLTFHIVPQTPEDEPFLYGKENEDPTRISGEFPVVTEYQQLDDMDTVLPSDEDETRSGG